MVILVILIFLIGAVHFYICHTQEKKLEFMNRRVTVLEAIIIANEMEKENVAAKNS